MIRVIDFESTGNDPTADTIIEIASVDLTRDGIVNPMQTLVNPHRPIPPHVSAVHHILDDDVAGAPDLVEAIDRFRGADVYVAHNAAFERAMITSHSIDLRADPQVANPTWICTYKCALRIWPEWPSHSNQALRYQLGLSRPFGFPRERIHPHRADSDVIVTAANLGEMLKVARWSDLVQWSSEPTLLTVFNFGKHRGKRFDAVPPDYLTWIIEKSELDEVAKHSARYWLSRMQQPAVA